MKSSVSWLFVSRATLETPNQVNCSCPTCGQLGLVTRKQISGLLPIICGSEKCSAQFFIRDEEIVARKPN